MMYQFKIFSVITFLLIFISINVNVFSQANKTVLKDYKNYDLNFVQAQSNTEAPNDAQEENNNKEEKTIENEILFIPNTLKDNAFFYQTISNIGMLSIGIGTTIALSTYLVSSNITTPGNLAQAVLFDENSLYNFMYASSGVLISLGTSFIYNMITYSFQDGTIEGYQKWKKQSILSGAILSGVGAGLLGTGVGMRSSSGAGTFELTDGMLTGFGTYLIIIGIPSILFGIFGVL